MEQTVNFVLFLLEAFIYFTLMITLLHFRHRIGLGVFLTALGVMHFVETYLAAVFYISLPIGVISPGSSVFFAGKLAMILILYIKEDASSVRQPIYGLFLGNLVTVAVAQLLLFHQTVELVPGQSVDAPFLREMGWLMIWGTTLLYLDSIGIILLFERLRRVLPRSVSLRFAIAAVVILTFDQIGFFALLNRLYGAPIEVFWGGWKAKMIAGVFYALLFALYQLIFRDHGAVLSARPLRDVFSDLTFRERYEDLLSRTGRDMLTGVYDRSRMELESPRLIRDALRQEQDISIAIVDVDHFKSVNDRFGHLVGDGVLKEIAAALLENIREEDLLFRYGGEEFVVLFPATDHQRAMLMAERLRTALTEAVINPAGERMTASLGVATGPADGGNFNTLLAVADERLYAAKNAGRDRVVGQPAQ